MNFTNKYRAYNILVLTMLMAAMAAIFSSCKEDDDKISGDPFFYIEGADNGVVVHMDVTGLKQDSWSFGAGDHYIVRANGNWELIPVDESVNDWMKVYPMAGKDEGILRFYAIANPMATIRRAEFRIILNGVEMPEHLVLAQDPSGPSLTVTANNIQIQQGGGINEIFVTANYEWEIETDPDANWLDVVRDDNKITISTTSANHTGTDRVTTIILRGTGENSDVTTPINVTQLNALFFDDFGWCYTPKNTTVDFCDEPDLDAVVCWGDQNLRIDKWIEPVKSANPGWTAIRGTSSKTAGPYTYSRYKYILFGTSNKCGGNICSPAISSIEGSINATVSFSMAGFVSAKNAQEAGNEFWVAILGPGRIDAATAGGNSTASIMTGSVTIPYEKSGNTPEGKAGTHDTDLTECAQFFIDKGNGYFNTDDPTGLVVWEQPETKFSITIDGMTAETRIVFIACDADNLTMETGEGWDVREGNSKYKSNRKLFDNFKVVEN